MVAPVKISFKIYQGSTFSETLRWESTNVVYKPITNITKTAPMIVTAVGHGMPSGWRCWVSGVIGMKEVNSADAYVSSDKTTDTITFNSVNASGYTAYTSGGILQYNEPVDLTSYTARMQIRSKITDSSIIHELTTENGGIIIDNTNKTIQLAIPASITADFTFSSAVYSLEMVKSGVVTPFITGTVTLIKEVTR